MARTMKDSGIEWIGMIPENWKQYHFKYIISAKIDNRGRTPTLNEDNIGIPIIELNAIGTKNPNVKNVSKFISKESYDKFIRNDLLAGDVLFGTVGSIGKCSIVPEGVNYCIAQNIVGYRFNLENDPLYWYFYFGSDAFKLSFMQYNKGNVLSSIKISDMERATMVVPPLSEQQKIAKFLDEKIGEIDTILSKTRESIEEYKKYKNAVVAETITKGLDKTVTMKESGIEWVGKIPSHWEVHTLSQVFMQLKNKNSDLSETNLLSLSYGKIKRKDINSSDGLLPESFDGYNVIDKNDIVLRLTDLQNDHKSLRVGHVKERGIITSAYVTLRCKEEIATDYYYYFLHTFDIYKGFYGMGAGVRQGLNYEGIRSMKILSPDIKEQQEIVEYLNAKCAEIDALIAKKEAFVQEMETYKKSLIYEYVTGKKEVV